MTSQFNQGECATRLFDLHAYLSLLPGNIYVLVHVRKMRNSANIVEMYENAVKEKEKAKNNSIRFRLS